MKSRFWPRPIFIRNLDFPIWFVQRPYRIFYGGYVRVWSEFKYDSINFVRNLNFSLGQFSYEISILRFGSFKDRNGSFMSVYVRVWSEFKYDSVNFVWNLAFGLGQFSYEISIFRFGLFKEHFESFMGGYVRVWSEFKSNSVNFVWNLDFSLG